MTQPSPIAYYRIVSKLSGLFQKFIHVFGEDPSVTAGASNRALRAASACPIRTTGIKLQQDSRKPRQRDRTCGEGLNPIRRPTKFSTQNSRRMGALRGRRAYGRPSGRDTQCSVVRLDANAVIDGRPNALLAAEVSLGGLD